ncbi:hypothetical protein [uncultured Methylobacterium sp.]|uniref:hypothetical protein n=1 Tax=uncultured Methylobacterium sp. TaxID=157278 RepID=UPI0035CA6C5B
MEQDFPDGPGLDAASLPRAETRAGGRRPRGAEGRLDAEARRRIGLNLRVLHAGLLAQPIPERFEAPVAAFAACSGEESSR